MAKEFTARVSKKKRASIDIPEKYKDRVFELSDQRLLEGAKLADIKLKDIEVRKQVRTKFNDASIKELAENIKLNGLIQPLVIHREGNKFVLICGERRYRAMTSIDMEMAPCFILEGKSNEELMAIQFSENSSREELHYIDQADSIYGYKKVTGYSERKIQAALGISKSEVHRCLFIARLPKKIKEAAKAHNTEKYVLLEWGGLEQGEGQSLIGEKIISGEIKKRLQLKRALKGLGVVKTKAVNKRQSKRENDKSTQALMMAMKEKSDDLKLDAKTKKLLNDLMKDAQNIVDS